MLREDLVAGSTAACSTRWPSWCAAPDRRRGRSLRAALSATTGRPLNHRESASERPEIYVRLPTNNDVGAARHRRQTIATCMSVAPCLYYRPFHARAYAWRFSLKARFVDDGGPLRDAEILHQPMSREVQSRSENSGKVAPSGRFLCYGVDSRVVQRRHASRLEPAQSGC